MNIRKSQLSKKVDQKCLNCALEYSPFKLGYCTKCYPLISKVRKIRKGILPSVLETIKMGYDSVFFEKSKEEYIRQVDYRLRIIKEAHSFKYVSAHDLEHRINDTLALLDDKSLGKINDSLASNLEDDSARSYVYQLFTKIQLLKPLRIDYYRVYDAGFKKN